MINLSSPETNPSFLIASLTAGHFGVCAHVCVCVCVHYVKQLSTSAFHHLHCWQNNECRPCARQHSDLVHLPLPHREQRTISCCTLLLKKNSRFSPRFWALEDKRRWDVSLTAEGKGNSTERFVFPRPGIKYFLLAFALVYLECFYSVTILVVPLCQASSINPR